MLELVSRSIKLSPFVFQSVVTKAANDDEENDKIK
jgi:hypothetical protein